MEGADHKRFNTSNLYPIFKKSLFCKALKKKHSIIQIGSSWGEEILYLNELAIENECEVYCIEPNAIRFECLKRNVKELKLKKIKCINKFASNKNSSNSISLDYFFKNKKISAIIIDTDGNELNVIQGGLKTIKKFKPLIVAEFLPKLDYSGFKGINVLGSTQGTKAELDEGLYWMGQGKIKAAVDSVYTFQQAAEAHTKMLSGKFFCKILLKPEGA